MGHCPFSQFQTPPRYISGGDAPAPHTCGLAYAVFITTSVTVEAASPSVSCNGDLGQDAF